MKPADADGSGISRRKLENVKSQKVFEAGPVGLKTKGLMTGSIYKYIAIIATVIISLFAIPIVRERRGSDLTGEDTDTIFQRVYIAVVILIILALAVFFYWNNKPI